jgi:hypothetical protein
MQFYDWQDELIDERPADDDLTGITGFVEVRLNEADLDYVNGLNPGDLQQWRANLFQRKRPGNN